MRIVKRNKNSSHWNLLPKPNPPRSTHNLCIFIPFVRLHPGSHIPLNSYFAVSHSILFFRIKKATCVPETSNFIPSIGIEESPYIFDSEYVFQLRSKFARSDRPVKSIHTAPCQVSKLSLGHASSSFFLESQKILSLLLLFLARVVVTCIIHRTTQRSWSVDSLIPFFCSSLHRIHPTGNPRSISMLTDHQISSRKLPNFSAPPEKSIPKVVLQEGIEVRYFRRRAANSARGTVSQINSPYVVSASTLFPSSSLDLVPISGIDIVFTCRTVQHFEKQFLSLMVALKYFW